MLGLSTSSRFSERMLEKETWGREGKREGRGEMGGYIVREDGRGEGERAERGGRR